MCQPREQRAQRQAQQRHRQRREQQRAADTGHRHIGQVGLDQRLDQEHREQHVIGQPFQPVPLRLQPHQAALQDEAEHDQQEHRQQCGDHHRHRQRSPRNLARRSSAPCRMNIAACSSITSARLARLTSMPISSRSTAAVESRSSHNPMARVGEGGKIAGKGAGRLRARPLAAVHVDGQAEHEARGVAFGRERQQPRRVGLEGLALQSSRRRSRAGGPDRKRQRRWSWCRDRVRQARRVQASARRLRSAGE